MCYRKHIFDENKHEENVCLKRKVENILPKVKITNDGDFILDAPTIYSNREVVGKFISKENKYYYFYVDLHDDEFSIIKSYWR